MSKIPDGVEISEGGTRLFVPKSHSERGPGKRGEGVFYNSQMAFNRDISVMFFQGVKFSGRALDGLAGTGARAVRVCNEVEGRFRFTANDRDPAAFTYIQANIELNRLENCDSSRSDLRCLLAEDSFDYIDIDPFGTPVPFVSAAIQGCRRRGILGITATDTAPLAGTYPKKCLRRYGSTSVRCSFGHELGLRILVAYLAREAAMLDRGIGPLLCFHADHYFRVHLKLTEGGGEADKSLRRLGYVRYEKDTGDRGISGEVDDSSFGPLWLGPLHDNDLLGALAVPEQADQPGRCSKYLDLWRGELDVPFFYDIDEISSLLRASPPPMEAVLSRLKESGQASRTHFSPTGFKTDLPLKEILSSLSGIV